MRKHLLAAAAAAITLSISAYPAIADMAAAEKWVDQEFQPSTLTKEQQLVALTVWQEFVCLKSSFRWWLVRQEKR